jgi:hypothetical protein
MSFGQLMVEFTEGDEDEVRDVKITAQVRPLLALAEHLKLSPHQLAAKGAAAVAKLYGEFSGRHVPAERIAPILTEPEFQPHE